MTCLALDFETTGLDCSSERVVEIGAVRFSLEGGRLAELASLACLVNPGKPMPAQARAIHGISDEELADSPSFAEVAPALLELARGAMIVAHNARFDLAFLDAELARMGRARSGLEYADTVPLARRAFPGRQSYRLGSIASALGIDPGRGHRALDDARTCMRLYAACRLRLDGADRDRVAARAR